MSMGFKGGIRLDHRLPKNLPVTDLEMPNRLFIDIPSDFTVRINDTDVVSLDTVIADHEDGSVIRANICGIVSAVNRDHVEIIPLESEDLKYHPICQRIQDITPKEIVEHISWSGLLSENGVPMWRMLEPLISSAELLIINAVETESGVSCKHAMLHNYQDCIVGGMKIVMKALGIGKAIVAMSEDMQYEANIFRGALKNKDMVDILSVCAKYPAENSRVLFSCLTGSRVSPSSRKAVMITVQDCIWVYDLFLNGRVIPKRVLTVNGQNYRVYIGTPLSEMSDLCGFVPEEGYICHVGGLVSAEIATNNARVQVGTYGVQYLPSISFETSGCIRCGRCSLYCPMMLVPSAFVPESNERLCNKQIESCIECGVCTAVCPVGISPLDAILRYKSGGKIKKEDKV